MNIIVLTYLFYPEPIVMSTITEDLATELSKEHSVTVVSSKPCRPYGYKLPSGYNKEWPFNRVILDSYTHPKSDLLGRLKENVSFGRAAQNFIKQNYDKIDVIYMNVFPLFAQQMVIRMARKYGIATVNHIEDIYPEPFRQKFPVFGSLLYKLLLPKDKWNIRNASYSVVIGDKIKEFFMKTRNVDGSNIKVVYNWQDETRFSRKVPPTIASNEFTFMYVGSISQAADLHTVLRAFVMANIPQTKLVFAGNGTERDALIKHAQESPNHKVEFVDAPFEKVAELQAMADVLILPLLKGVSLRAVPSKLPAYMFSAKPIIACVDQEGDVANILKGSCAGWVVEPESCESLKNIMREVHEKTREELVSMGLAGYAFSQANLTKDVNLKKLSDIIVLAGKER